MMVQYIIIMVFYAGGMDMGENKKYNVPMISGEYNLYLDVIDENKQIRSYLIPIEVKNED